VLTYSADDNRADYYAANINVTEGSIRFDLHHPKGVIRDVALGVPVWVNIENSIAASAIAMLCGVTDEAIREGLASYAGVYRRFNIHVQTPRIAYIDDYAHHPQEIAASIASVRRLYPQRRLIGIFQPHLYTRTRDFADAFAKVLSTLDEVILLPIYPARETNVYGVTSDQLAEAVAGRGTPARCLHSFGEAADEIREKYGRGDCVITVGAGDVEKLAPMLVQV
jgi:UDP-N-acetylmuramate--alanine ligase